MQRQMVTVSSLPKRRTAFVYPSVGDAYSLNLQPEASLDSRLVQACQGLSLSGYLAVLGAQSSAQVHASYYLRFHHTLCRPSRRGCTHQLNGAVMHPRPHHPMARLRPPCSLRSSSSLTFPYQYAYKARHWLEPYELSVILSLARRIAETKPILSTTGYGDRQSCYGHNGPCQPRKSAAGIRSNKT
ncbi:hypothetical protein LX32DRAFT_228540 [Colletotrichum zoysiae]|uniref:Uncharacterized protein n=1 Tax=Colletotrichum zoysiae TaxID=1216348 RepID=A0AAD9HPN2_9PEZI|nr:hypothetical protein LX32DRAFT_228540 [Colletotrichum zoysiae]